MSTRISRSTFIKGLAGVGVAAVSGKLLLDHLRARAEIPCRMLGPSKEFGHMIRDRQFAGLGRDTGARENARSCKVAIVGGGVAGLSAAWWLKKNGCADFILLELEKEVGGNSSFGKNEYSAFPWGAHYVPMANKESLYVRELFEELGVIEGISNGMPVYNELFLCHDPQERLYKDGSFQEGLVPRRGLQASDRDQVAKFFGMVNIFRNAVGKDAKPAFAIPIELSSQDDEYLRLDQISMAEWLEKNGLNARPLVWYVNYCCRDDYGSTIENVSAWAGIHYFAGRRGAGANAEPNSLVTWPEGNGYIINKLREAVNDKIMTGALVTEISGDERGITTNYIDTTTRKPSQVRSQFTIFAAPRFLAKYIVAHVRSSPKSLHLQPSVQPPYSQQPVQLPHAQPAAQSPSQAADAGSSQTHPPFSSDPDNTPLNYDDLVYAPWMVANISLKRVPDSRGTGLAWDNVSYYSNSLGYVVASHQNITTRQKPTVITYYYPLSDYEPRAGRAKLMTASARQWSEMIIGDLESMHPDIRKEIISIDLWPWGHGMIRPSVGFIWGETRKRMHDNVGNVYFAHSDMSGISNFEEAQYHGVEAAKQILSKLG